MSQTMNLDELKKLAGPALRHVELVDLARTGSSPSKVQRVAAARWPRRQANAARFLAIMLRDHGDDVFEAFVTTTNRTRSPREGVEHVRGE
jgi:hypothetical protein